MYKQQRAWSDKFIPYLKMILGYAFIDIANEKQDMEENTDLIMFCADKKNIACRVRRNSWLQRKSNEFTIRYDYSEGYKTEYQKILDGMGDFLLYCFADQNEEKIAAWRIIDLSAFRYLVKNGLLSGQQIIVNKDNVNSFMAIDIAKNPELNYKCSQNLTQELKTA